MSYIGINQQPPHSGRYVNENGELVNIVDIMEYQVGGKGAEFISDTVTHNATNIFSALQIISDATISAYTTDANSTIIPKKLIRRK
jgi:translation elongation factor P/translation initiation factor 5A